MLTYEQALEILSDGVDGKGLRVWGGEYVSYRNGDTTVCLDGDFDAETLEAIAIYIRHNRSSSDDENSRV